MKKLFALLLVLLLTACCAHAESLYDNLESMTLEELISLKAAVESVLKDAYAAQDSGEYPATREQPAPIGASVRYDGSFYLNPAVTDLTVVKVLRGDAAWNKIQSWNSYNPRPAEGQEYILVCVSARSIAAENDAKAEIYDYDFSFVSASGVEYEYAYAAGVDAELNAVYPGGQTEGWIVGLIRSSDDPLLVYLPASDEPVWFDLSSQAPSDFPEDMGLEPLMRGDTGESVREIQEILIEMGYLNDKADGTYGKNTKTAVLAYQADMGLQPTGIADEETLYLLLTGSLPE